MAHASVRSVSKRRPPISQGRVTRRYKTGLWYRRRPILPKPHVGNGYQRAINFIGICLRLSILFNSLTRSFGHIYSFHINALLEGSVSTHCSLDTCRSTLEAAANCYNTSTCLAITPKGPGEKYCMSCTCPAEVATLNKNGMFYFRNIQAFQKGKYGVFS